LDVARKERHRDKWDRPVEPYDPYGSGDPETDFVTGHGELVTGNGDNVTDE
jgi:hypothetical protein